MESEGRSPFRILRHALMISEVFTAVFLSTRKSLSLVARRKRGGALTCTGTSLLGYLETWFARVYRTGGDGSAACPVKAIPALGRFGSTASVKRARRIGT